MPIGIEINNYGKWFRHTIRMAHECPDKVWISIDGDIIKLDMTAKDFLRFADLIDLMRNYLKENKIE